jgi:hypothetical protein
MTRYLPNTTRPLPRVGINQRHSHALRVGPTGKSKTALLVLLAKMKKLTVQELVQRYKLS